MTFGNNGNPISDAAFAASRQVWLASLGAAAVTREWARTEAGKTFRTLVKHGSTVENRAIRVLGDRIETSIANATSIWKQTRATAMTTASTIAETANAALSQFKAPTATRNRSRSGARRNWRWSGARRRVAYWCCHAGGH